MNSRSKSPEQSNKEIIQREVKKFIDRRPHRIPSTVTSTLVLAALLEETEQQTELLKKILQAQGGEAGEKKPGNFLQQLFKRKTK